MNRGVQQFYFTRILPPRSVAIAHVSTAPTSPATLTDISNSPYFAGDLSIRKASTLDASPPDFIAADFMQPVMIHGATQYRINDQFFELTNVLLNDGTPGFYVHAFPSEVDQLVIILDVNNNPVTPPIFRIANLMYHTLDGAPYRVRYVDGSGYLHTDLLKYIPALSIAPFSSSSTTYQLTGRNLILADNGNYWIRFTQKNGYLSLVPYNNQPNTPWFARIRFGLTPPAPEWALQTFLPQRPYMLATWVPGVVLDSSLIEFERKQIFYDPLNLPSILVFDKNYVIKYALDGSQPGSPPVRGTLYNWRRGLVQFIDPYKARVQIAVQLDPTDIVFGFYSYLEPDVVYNNLDVNPFTNPAVKDKVIEFYYKDNGKDTFHFIYHQVIDQVTGPVVGATNDPDPTIGTNHIFANLLIGAGIGVQNFTVTDVRNRGGGLGQLYQNTPQAVNFWDLGYWDGKPYPIGGTLAVYVPAYILNTMSSADVTGLIQAALPVGVLPTVRYYNDDGSEVIE